MNGVFPFLAIAPLVSGVCDMLEPIDQATRLLLFESTVAKACPTFDKLDQDIRGRLGLQTNVMRAARTLGFFFVASTPLLAVANEIVYFAAMPTIANMDAALAAELPMYQELATIASARLLLDINGVVIEPNPVDLWNFWLANSLRLPSWYLVACQIALIMTSSGCVERVFSLYDSLFDESQESALEDRREASVMLSFNRNQRKKEQ